MDNSGKESGFMIFFIVMGISLLAALLWDQFSFIKNTVHYLLDPTAGILLRWDLTLGMFIIVLIVSLGITLIQKYATDQKTLRELKDEQKLLQEEMKKFKDHPEKLMELQKKQMEFIPKTMRLSMRPLMFTGVPLILFYRWFNDFFTAAGNPLFFGFLSWLWFYLIFSILFNSLLRKILNVV